MSQPYRLPAGGRINRDKPIRFTFNGKVIQCFEGDTIASALIASGERLIGRSFKYHRPRGIISHGVDEPNALLRINRGPGRADPNSRGTVVTATNGLVVTSQNHWPSLKHDVNAVNDWLAPIFTAGFYYKTFMWPRSFWNKLYEPLIRAMAGLGTAPDAADPDYYLHHNAHCEVLVVGGGPAGLATALAASGSGKRVILADEQAELGGALLHDRDSVIDGLAAAEWLERTLAELRARDNVVLLPRATAFGYYNDNYIGLAERVTDHLPESCRNLPRERLWQVRAARVILATGAHERPLTFPDNDRPNIMLAESIRIYANRYAALCGRNIVFATTGASAYRAAEDLLAAGANVTVVDLRAAEFCANEASALRARGAEVLTRHAIIGSTGRKRVTGITVAAMDSDGRPTSFRTLPCDCVGLSGGWTPAVHLYSQSRGTLAWEPTIGAPVPDKPKQKTSTAGAAKGTFDLASCLAEGWVAGIEAIGGTAPRSFDVTPRISLEQGASRELPHASTMGRGRSFVDFQNDVTTKDIGIAIREGFRSIEHVKRYTTAGMATDQGKTSNVSVIELVSNALPRPIAEVGTTTFRPPYTPVTFGALAGPSRGEMFDPICKTPIHEWAASRGAVFEDVGLWKRARYFPEAGEDMRAAVSRECQRVRTTVGIFDASTLGKIEVVGPDAAEFMNRLYINDWTKLRPGRCRYGVLLKEDGFILDDGVVARLAADRFHVTTTTGGAARVLAQMEDYRQTEWPDFKVFATSITEHWAVIAVQGPKARELIAPLVTDIDMTPEAFPHMSVRIGRICGALTRLFRVSFTGELGYEINVPASDALAVWEAVYTRGKDLSIVPYGTETMHVLRAERGFIIVGQETDGTVSPDDVGLAGMIAKAKPDFVGKRSLARPALVESGRMQLVGIATTAPELVLDEGAQIVEEPSQGVPISILGRVTSAYWSPACNRSIALALVRDGRSLMGSPVHVTTPDGFAAAQVVAPVFVDPTGARVNA